MYSSYQSMNQSMPSSMNGPMMRSSMTMPRQSSISNSSFMPSMSQDNRFAGGFLGPFVLGGITGGLLAPAFYPRPYYQAPYYGPYYGPYYYR